MTTNCVQILHMPWFRFTSCYGIPDTFNSSEIQINDSINYQYMNTPLTKYFKSYTAKIGKKTVFEVYAGVQ